ncbi:putative methyltransferase DDB_G0268948 isoform X2 [Scleropages formosus]|uniref:putative methyltransferase DDB_G0268948 isoform X2 n=1 Tax=Scleropages formosus TaxID=113540 RepID=UPI000878F7D8|nr:putative methyltransferase DDB_G0268948 isoform X2 [Scleropages formosus]
MTHRLFEDKHHASIYQQYRFVPPVEVKNLILQYLDEKKEPPHVLAVDLGCGTGQNTRLLAPHFQEVVGIDVSENQISEANAVPGFPNVTYRVGTAEELPFQDGSVDLLTAASAAHWFNQDKFLKEASRTLKPRGCIALLSYTDALKFHYSSAGDTLNSIYEEMKNILLPYASPQVAVVNSKLQAMYDAIPFRDKKRLTREQTQRQVKPCSGTHKPGFLRQWMFHPLKLR